jgi:hypothetical protein
MEQILLALNKMKVYESCWKGDESMAEEEKRLIRPPGLVYGIERYSKSFDRLFA